MVEIEAYAERLFVDRRGVHKTFELVKSARFATMPVKFNMRRKFEFETVPTISRVAVHVGSSKPVPIVYTASI